jgi:Fe-S-cluster-containing hydrogenase component 2
MTTRNIIEIDEEKCNGCGACVIACAEGAIEVRDGKARIIKESYCDGLGACMGECPEGALTIVARQAAPFDEEAVHAHLENLKGRDRGQPSGDDKVSCPGTKLMQFPAPPSVQVKDDEGRSPSALRNWPVQIHLLPGKAPFFKGAHLLVAGDCLAFSMGDFHQQLLQGKVLAVGCPKLDNVRAYVEKLTQIVSENDIQSVTVAYMEVPCCSGILRVVGKALEASGKGIPLFAVKVGISGKVLEECDYAAPGGLFKRPPRDQAGGL